MKINIVKPFLPKLSDIQNEISECLDTGLVTNNTRYVRELKINCRSFLVALLSLQLTVMVKCVYII